MDGIAKLTEVADYITRAGFLAVGLVLIFIVAPVLFKITSSKLLATISATIGVVFLIVFGLRDFIRDTYPGLLPQPFTLITGTVRGVANGSSVTVQSNIEDDGIAYMRLEYDKVNRDLNNYPFIFVLDKAPVCISVTIVPPQGPGFAVSDLSNAGEGETFDIAPLNENDIKSGAKFTVRIDPASPGHVAVVTTDLRRTPPSVKNYKAIGKNQKSCPASAPTKTTAWLFPPASAQTSGYTKAQDRQDRLRSDDVVRRRNARIDLTLEGADAFGEIEGLLASNEYRLQLGAVAAIAGMSTEVRKKMPTSLVDSARRLLVAPDRTLRDTTLQAIEVPALCYQEQDTSKAVAQKYLVQCYFNKEQCERVRGPNLRPGVSQSACTAVDLSRSNWRYNFPGFEGGWYQFSPDPLPQPFPQIVPK